MTAAKRPPGAWKAGTSEAERLERGLPRVVSVRISPDAIARIDAEARRRGLSRSALIEALAAELPEAEAD